MACAAGCVQLIVWEGLTKRVNIQSLPCASAESIGGLYASPCSLGAPSASLHSLLVVLSRSDILLQDACGLGCTHGGRCMSSGRLVMCARVSYDVVTGALALPMSDCCFLY